MAGCGALHAGPAESGKLSEHDLRLLHLTDDIDDAVRVVQEAYKAWEDIH